MTTAFEAARGRCQEAREAPGLRPASPSALDSGLRVVRSHTSQNWAAVVERLVRRDDSATHPLLVL